MVQELSARIRHAGKELVRLFKIKKNFHREKRLARDTMM
jgi:hypothetical protein